MCTSVLYQSRSTTGGRQSRRRLSFPIITPDLLQTLSTPSSVFTCIEKNCSCVRKHCDQCNDTRSLTVRSASILQVLTLSVADMADLMDVDDGASPRGTKRTADEAGLPPEAPRRIRARSDRIKVGFDSTNVISRLSMKMS